MNGRIAYEACSGGIRITRMNSVDKTIEVPSSVDGLPVTAIGPSFLSGSPGKGSRTLVIPSSVVDMDPEMLDGIASITEIDYDGDLSVFQRSKVVACSDCTLRCRDCGEEFDFDFFAGQPMSFPEFDDLILSLCLRLTPEIALKRLTHPVGLTPENRERYRRFLSGRIMPKAEQCVVGGDIEGLIGLFDSDMLSDDDMRRLLRRSVESGRTAVTSTLMSEIGRRSSPRRLLPRPLIAERAPTCSGPERRSRLRPSAP